MSKEPEAQELKCPTCGAPCEVEKYQRGSHHGSYTATRYKYCPPDSGDVEELLDSLKPLVRKETWIESGVEATRWVIHHGDVVECIRAYFSKPVPDSGNDTPIKDDPVFQAGYMAGLHDNELQSLPDSGDVEGLKDRLYVVHDIIIDHFPNRRDLAETLQEAMAHFAAKTGEKEWKEELKQWVDKQPEADFDVGAASTGEPKPE